ncbi:MAG: acyl-ACP thioesterase [Treponema sp.]|jgi:acyl-ACP thioesterase|nr:acyl-ACP thioesterase [Treponema sp.]
MNCNPANPNGSEKLDVWQETFPIRFGVIDKSDRLTLDAVFQFFQEAAISHAQNLGVGREDMAKAGQVWIISRMSVLVDRRPNYCEAVSLRTWPRGFERLFAIRDYQIKDKDEKAVISARSAWLIIDIDKRRPIRPEFFKDLMPLNEGLEAVSAEANTIISLKEQESLQKAAERKALYTDLDYNGHVNNVRYIQWIEDSLDPVLLENAGKLRLDINYLSEIISGETISLFSAPIQIDNNACQTFAFEGRKTESNTAAFRAELKIW